MSTETITFTRHHKRVLSVIFATIEAEGQCTSNLALLALAAQSSKSTVRTAIQLACEAGLLVKTERRHGKRPNDPNILTTTATPEQIAAALRPTESIASEALANGLNPFTAYVRLRRGIPRKEALQPGRRPGGRKKSVVPLAIAAGLKPPTVYARLRRGETLERALTGTRPKGRRPSLIVFWARAIGVKAATLRARINKRLANPMTPGPLPKAVNPQSIRQLAIARGVQPGTVYMRRRRGWTLAEALDGKRQPKATPRREKLASLFLGAGG